MRRFVLIVLFLCSLGAVQLAKAQSHQLPARDSGKKLFHDNCASCHGEDAKGAGPAAMAFKVQPPDLTTLSRQNHGKFPKDRVVKSIRGDRIGAHGSTEMPVWGPLFLGLTGMNQEEAERSISDLTKYIRAVQLK